MRTLRQTGMGACFRRALVVAVGMASRATCAGDWPAIHGNMDHTGVTAEDLALPLGLAWITQADQPPSPAFYKGLTGKFPENAASQDYVFQPVVAGKRLYFGSSTEEAVYCLDTANGARVWKTHLDGAIRMAPTLDGGNVYVGTDGGSVYCLAGETGAEKWRFRVGPTPYACVGNSRIASSWPVRGGIVIRDGIAYFAAGVYPTMGAWLYAVEAATGALKWERSVQNAPNGALRIVDGDKIWVSSGCVAPAEFRLSDGRPSIPDPDRRGARGGWWIGDVDGLPAWGPTDNHVILFRLATNAPPGRWKNSSASEANTVPPGILSGTHGYGALAADKFYLLGRDNEVLAVPLPAFREVCAKRAAEIRAMDRWSYGWVMAADLEDDEPFTAALQKNAAWTTKVPNDQGRELRWGIAAGSRLFLGGAGGVVALDVDTGRPAWTAAVDGEARGLAAADGALFVSTDKGKIYAFRPGAAGPAVTNAPSFSSAYADDALYEEAARVAVAAAGRAKGYGVVLGAGEGELAYRIARQSEFYVVCLDKDPGRVAAARAKLAQAGVYGTRVVVYHEPNDPPACAPYFANLVVSDEALTTGKVPYSAAGAMRLVQPYSGAIVLASPKDRGLADGWSHPEFSAWTATNGASGVTWRVARRGALPGAGEWTQAYANPANTVCSGDRLVSTNLLVQWYGPPGTPDMVDRHNMSVCPLVKDGRIYRVGGFSPSSQGLDSTSVTAIDAYNGTILWSAKFPGSGRRLAGHNTHPCAIVGDSLFVTSGAACQQVDGLTGAVRHTFEGVRPGCDWGYVGGWNDRLVGSSQGTGVDRETLGVRNFGSPGFSSRPASSRDLFVFDLAGRKKLWTYTGGAILNVSITGDPVRDTLYFVESRNAAALADTTGQMEFSKFLERDATGGAQLVALDAQTGAVRWTQPIARNVDKPDQWILYLTYADGVLLVSRSYFETREDGKTWYGYDFEALDADAGGRTLWQTWKPAPWVNRGQTWKNPLHSHPFYAQGKFWFMARYYGAVFSFDPRTGKETADAAFGTGWEQGEAKSCTTPAASESAFYFRRNSHFLYDLSARRTMDLTRVSRPACWMSIIPACGLVTMLEQSAGCTCGFAIRLSTAFVPRDAAALPAAAGR